MGRLFFKYRALFCLALVVSACARGEVDYARSLAVPQPADIVLRNAKIVTGDQEFSIQRALAIKGGRFLAVGGEREMLVLTGRHTRVVDLGGRTVIPGLIDSHVHATLAGLSWDAELHWESTRSLSDGLKLIADAVQSKPAGSWVVVGGGWVPTQFSDRRFPTRAELDAMAPDHPVYIQYLRQGALLNGAALRAVGITRGSADPSGGVFERDGNGELTGWLRGVPAWEYAYNKVPRPSLDQMRQSLRNCFRELNRLGVTSVGDIQTGGVNFVHRRLLADMARSGDLTLRVNFYISPNEPGDELEQLKLAVEEVKQLPQSDLFRFAGFGEVLIRGTGDGDVLSNPNGLAISPQAREKFLSLARFLAAGGYNYHLHATHDSTARQLLDMLEQVHASVPASPQRLAFAHLEDASAETLVRIRRLGGGVAVQGRMALTGERNVELWGLERARNAPPLRRMLEAGLNVGAGSDGMRAGNYSPMLSLWWLISGKTVAGSALRGKAHHLTRQEALRMYTAGSAWFTADERRKGSIEVGKLADLAVLNGDYLTVPEEQIRSLESVLTMIGGRVVYAAGPFAPLAGRAK